MNKTDTSETLLWARFKDGDKAALHQIYTAHIEALLQYGYRFSTDKSLVEDCAHDLFVYLWQHRASIGQTDAIGSYLMVVLRRRIIKTLTERGRVRGMNPNDDNRAFELNIEQSIAHEEQNSERKKQLQMALDQLSARQKEAVFLKYYKNLAYEDICQIMEINYQSARNLVFSGIQSLRKLMHMIWWITCFWLVF